MKTFRQYTADQIELEEGFMDIMRKLGKALENFHTAKNLDSGTDEILQRAEWHLSQMRPGDKRKEPLAKFIKTMKSLDTSTHKNRLKLGQTEKEAKQLLKTFNISVKV